MGADSLKNILDDLSEEAAKLNRRTARLRQELAQRNAAWIRLDRELDLIAELWDDVEAAETYATVEIGRILDERIKKFRHTNRDGAA